MHSTPFTLRFILNPTLERGDVWDRTLPSREIAQIHSVMTRASSHRHRPICPLIGTLICCVHLAFVHVTSAQPTVLADAYPPAKLASILVPRDDWHPFPRYADREGWTGLPDAARDALIKRGEAVLARSWPDLPAALYLGYARNGNRSDFEGVYFERRRRLQALVLAECMEAKGRFLDAAANALWSICEETSWCIPAHLGMQKSGVGLPDSNEPIVDLFAAQTAVSVAWTLYLIGPQLDEISPMLRRRAEQEIDHRILTPYGERDFGWMGFGSNGRAGRPNNWNPWINASVLTATLVVEPDGDRRVRLVHRILRSLDQFIQPYPADGGCDEGPGYWSRAGGSVMDSLDLLFSATRGELSVFGDDLIREMGRFIYRVHIADDWYVDIGDCPARTEIDRDLVYRYGHAIRDPQLEALATAGARLDELVRGTDSYDFGRALSTLADLPKILAGRGVSPPFIADAWLGSDDLQMMIARDKEGSTDGFFVAAWGGHNAQSHNHNDVGNFIVSVDGHPVFVDLGAPTYTAKTFSSRRYEIPAMQSGYHNLPTINGTLQSAGRQFAAHQVRCDLSAGSAELSMDIAAAWPAEAGVKSWLRTVRLDRGQQVSVMETFELTEARAELSLNLMTPRPVSVDEPGKLRIDLPSGSGEHPAAMLQYPAEQLEASLEAFPLNDARLEKVWGETLTRISLRSKSPSLKNTWTLQLTLVTTSGR